MFGKKPLQFILPCTVRYRQIKDAELRSGKTLGIYPCREGADSACHPPDSGRQHAHTCNPASATTSRLSKRFNCEMT